MLQEIVLEEAEIRKDIYFLYLGMCAHFCFLLTFLVIVFRIQALLYIAIYSFISGIRNIESKLTCISAVSLHIQSVATKAIANEKRSNQKYQQA